MEDSTPAAPSTPLSPVAAAPSLAAEPKWKLTGISKGPDGRYFAIINGQLRSESEYVDGAIVHAIERDRVTLRVNGEEMVLRLY
ncbi:MAG: hypothetical protein N3A53_00550 [Verrucomicrobiae bacterium]|nr:hypothetical protein [Verrucomicrobiae bacterium]